MTAYIVRRLLQTVLVLVGVTALSFGTMFLSGDPAMAMAGENWTREQIDDFRQTMGFDRPWYVQYADFLSRAVRGDFGMSLRQKQPTFSLIVDRMPNTIQLAALAMGVAISLGLPLGVVAALKRGSIWDGLLMIVGLTGQAMPPFWLGLLLIMVFAVWLRWLPVAGAGTPQHLILPAVTLGTFSAAYIARLARSSMLEVLDQDYVRTARAKGLPGRRVVIGHALRNALIPLVTVVGLQVGSLLGGAIITETIFAWPGVGRLTIDAVNGKDLPLVQACVTVLAATFVLINLVVDLLYTYLDPRIRLS
jgi:peptide/nickel transport system permease protein